MYCYVTCRPDIGYAIVTMSKFSSKPLKLHYRYLKSIAKYLRNTKHWGIRFKRTIIDNMLPPPKIHHIFSHPSTLPDFPVDINEPVLKAFTDAAYANDHRNYRSTTGYLFTYCGGAIIYRSKTQSVNALSSTEAEFIERHARRFMGHYSYG